MNSAISMSGARLLLLVDARDPAGEPRVALVPATTSLGGRRPIPVIYPNIRAALAAKQNIEAAAAPRRIA